MHSDILLYFFLFSLLLLPVVLWIVALVRIWNAPYRKLEKATWLVLIVVFPILFPLLFLVLRDGRERQLA